MTLARAERTQRADQPTQLPFAGFNETGAFFRSEREIDNDITLFIRDILPMIRTKFLAPADVELMLRTAPAWVSSGFPNAAQWADWTRAWQWFAATDSTSAEAMLKRRGPPNVRIDPNAFEHWLEDAERFHGYECRYECVPASGIQLLGMTLPVPPSLRLHCRVHGDFPKRDLPLATASPTVARGGRG